MSGEWAAWDETLDPLDLVFCYFPDDGQTVPSYKPRPALVLSVNDDETPLRLQVAYATRRKTRDKYAGEFTIGAADGATFNRTGLTGETKFDLGRLVWLPYDTRWFKPDPAGKTRNTPKLGHLDIRTQPELRRRFEAAARAAGLI